MTRSIVLVVACLALAGCGTLSKKVALPQPAKGPLVYVVLFPKTSAAISQKAAAIINSVAGDANRHRWRTVEVTGPSTRKAPGYDSGLAAVRIQTVVRALAAAGVPEKRIARGFPPSAQPPDEKAAQQVEIRLVEKPR